MYGGDLGIMWDNGAGSVNVAFGDNDGPGYVDACSGSGAGVVRHSALAQSSNHDLNNGLRIDTMIQSPPGAAKDVLNNVEGFGGRVPTAGIHVGNADYLAYMTIHSWQPWQTSNGGIAYSPDGGQTWSEPQSAIWSNNANYTDNFQQSALADSGGYVYKYGTPNGRSGNAYVSRVPESGILTPSAYQYWDGNTWQTGNEAAAAPIVAGPVGELSVQYDSSLGVWLMTYLDNNTNAIVLRTAWDPQGPWSNEQSLVTPGAVPGVNYYYGGFIHPWSSGPDLYFSVSLAGPYQTYLMHSALTVIPRVGGGRTILAHDGTEYVFTRDAANGHLQATYAPPGGSWASADMNMAAGTPAMAGDPSAMVASDGQINIFTRNANGDLQQTYLPKGGQWGTVDLTVAVGTPATGDNPRTVQTQDSTIWVWTRNASNGDLEATYFGSGAWHLSDFSWLHVPVMAGTPDAMVASDGQMNIFTRNANGDLQQTYIPKGGQWGTVDLTAAVGTPATNTDPSSIVDGNGTVTVYTRNATNGDLTATWFAAAAWHVTDMAAQAGTPPLG
jgi:hypothetical protein